MVFNVTYINVFPSFYRNTAPKLDKTQGYGVGEDTKTKTGASITMAHGRSSDHTTGGESADGPVLHLQDVPCGDTLVLAKHGGSRWHLSGDFDLTEKTTRYVAHERQDGIDFADLEAGKTYKLKDLEEAAIAACRLCDDPQAPCRTANGVKTRLVHQEVPANPPGMTSATGSTHGR